MGNHDEEDDQSSRCSSSSSSSSSSSMSTSSRSYSHEEEEEEWGGWEDEGAEALPTQCLLSPLVLPTPAEALAADRAQGLDLVGVLSTHGLGLYRAIKLINYVRTLVLKEGLAPEVVMARVQDQDQLLSVLNGEAGNAYLQPVLEDDPLLFALGNLLDAHGLELMDEEEEEHGEGGQEDAEEEGEEQQQQQQQGVPTPTTAVEAENQELRQEVTALRARLARLSELMRAVDEDVKVRTKPARQDNDTYYFNSYAHHGIHETMLRDRVRTESYQLALQAAGPLLAGKTVLDVGAGSGVLSMFAAQAGAAQVVGVDRSDIVGQARAIVQLNGLDQAVTLVQGKVEDIALPVEKVDAIVSEWMGYCLLYESMLPSVLVARDKYLRPGGLLLPSRVTMLIEGVSDLDGRLGWWSNVYGLDMSPLRGSVLAEPAVEAVDPQAVMTDAYTFKDFDLYTVQTTDLDFEAEFTLSVTKAQALRGLVVSFDTFFEGLAGGQTVSFSTRPEAQDTHWHQTVFWLQWASEAALAAGDKVTGNLRFVRNAVNPRDYDVEIAWVARGKEGGGEGRQKYVLGS